MGGGLLQLVAYGAQDVYLTGNPQITFFKVVYRRHTNFALESIQQTFNGTVAYGQKVTSTIARNGDLISRVYLVVSADATNACPYFGLRLIKYAEVEIGGQKIDKHYSDWMYIWNELSLPISKKNGYYEMVGGKGGDISSKTLYVPLEFWFCRNVGLALPLISLQYHEIKINIQFEEKRNCYTRIGAGTETSIEPAAATLNAHLWVDYIYLDTDERRKFAQTSHEYLIEQLQFTGKEALSEKIRLNFNHPVKELVWTIKKPISNNEHDTNRNWFNYSKDGNELDKNTLITDYNDMKKLLGPRGSAKGNTYTKAKILLNGNDRFTSRDNNYFNLIQPFQHHENVPNNAGINVYSFALKPEEHQPSGTLNMSRIDTSFIKFEIAQGVTTSEYIFSIYAVNYNILRIMSGMGGIAYSN